MLNIKTSENSYIGGKNMKQVQEKIIFVRKFSLATNVVKTFTLNQTLLIKKYGGGDMHQCHFVVKIMISLEAIAHLV